MADHVGTQLVEHGEQVRVAEIGFDEVRARRDVRAAAGGEVVDDAHAPAALEKGVGDVRADESGATGDENVLRHEVGIVAFLRVARKTAAITAPKRKPPGSRPSPNTRPAGRA